MQPHLAFFDAAFHLISFMLPCKRYIADCVGARVGNGARARRKRRGVMAVLFMQSQHAAIIPAAVTATRHYSRMADFSPLSFSLRIPFFYHLASPLPVEASCIQRSKSCSVSKSERRLHKITNSIHSLKQPRRVSSLLAQYSICGFAGLFNFSFHFEGSRRFPSRSALDHHRRLLRLSAHVRAPPPSRESRLQS